MVSSQWNNKNRNLRFKIMSYFQMQYNDCLRLCPHLTQICKCVLHARERKQKWPITHERQICQKCVRFVRNFERSSWMDLENWKYKVRLQIERLRKPLNLQIINQGKDYSSLNPPFRLFFSNKFQICWIFLKIHDNRHHGTTVLEFSLACLLSY